MTRVSFGEGGRGLLDLSDGSSKVSKEGLGERGGRHLSRGRCWRGGEESGEVGKLIKEDERNSFLLFSLSTFTFKKSQRCSIHLTNLSILTQELEPLRRIPKDWPSLRREMS